MGNSAVILIIPSASYRTGPFMNAIKKLDLKVLVISDKSQVFSGKYPDNLIIINFNHWKDKSVEISKWAKNNGLKAVIGVDEESIVLAANLSNFLNVDHNSIESVLLTKNKYLMRTELKKTGLCSPWFKIFSIYESSNKIINEISFPCVIKPTFLSGSRGVMRVNTKKELSEGIKTLNELLSLDELRKRGGKQSDYIMIEEYIPGKEVAIEGIVSEGKLTMLAIFDKPELLEGPTFEETIIVTPSVLTKKIQYSLLETLQVVVKALGIVKGPVHAEARINRNGNYILECASRSIGGLCSKVLEFQGGISLEELILRSYLGRNIEKSKLIGNARGVMMMPTEKKGILKEIGGVKDALVVNGVTDLQITVKPGEKLQPLPKGDRYLGFIFAEGNNQEFVINALKNAWSKIEIVLENDLSK
jgi:biotin carboxylase